MPGALANALCPEPARRADRRLSLGESAAPTTSLSRSWRSRQPSRSGGSLTGLLYYGRTAAHVCRPDLMSAATVITVARNRKALPTRLGGRELWTADGVTRRAVGSAVRRFRHGPPPASSDARDVWALRDVSFDVATGRDRRGRRRERSGEDDSSQAALADHRADGGHEPSSTAASARCSRSGPASTRSSPGRENVFLNGAILGMRGRDRREVRRDRRVRRARAVPRHPGQALLERDVRPPRVRGRGASRAGDPARRRGPGRRRPGFQQKCLGTMGEIAPQRPDRLLRQPQPRIGCRPVHPCAC